MHKYLILLKKMMKPVESMAEDDMFVADFDENWKVTRQDKGLRTS